MQSRPPAPSSFSAPAARSPAAPRRPTTTSATAPATLRRRDAARAASRAAAGRRARERAGRAARQQGHGLRDLARAGARVAHHARAARGRRRRHHARHRHAGGDRVLPAARAGAGQAGGADRRRCGRPRRASPTARRTCRRDRAWRRARARAAWSSSSPARCTRRCDVRKVHTLPARRVRAPATPGRSRASRRAGCARCATGREGDGARGLERARRPTPRRGRGWRSSPAAPAPTARASRALVDAGVAGIVVAGTGNGTRPRALEARAARGAGARRARCCAARAASTAP